LLEPVSHEKGYDSGPQRPAAKLDRLPPQNIEAEQSVIGAILLENEAISPAIESLAADDFYKEAHRQIFLAMLDLYGKSEPIDLITLTEQLSKKEVLEKVGGASYLSSIASMVPTAANIKHYSKIVKEKAILRNLITTATEIITTTYDSEQSVNEVLDQAESKIFSISEDMVKQSYVHIKNILKDTIEMVDKLYNKKELITGMPSGFMDLDEATTGFHPGDLVIIGARPGMGKTAFCLNLVTNAAISEKRPIAFFSLEMTKDQLVLRMICSEAEVDSKAVRSGYHSKEDYRKLVNSAGRLADAPIFIDDSFNTVLDIRAKCRRLKSEHGLGLVVIDYLQLMSGTANVAREQVISDISRSLKALAKDLSVPIVVISQLNRSCETRGDNKRPLIADLRESGAIEQDADIILFLYRGEYYTDVKDAEPGMAELNIAKQRNGPTKTIKLSFIDKYTKFKNYTAQDVY
jgi:replicative DNA helicase